MSDEVEAVTTPVIAPGEYFNALKEKKQKINDDILGNIYDNCLALLEKYDRTGQVDAMKKLIFHIDTIEKEREALKAGIDTFVYLADVKKYVEQVQDRVVKIIELERYEREVPDEIVEAYEAVKGVFTKFFVVFTDYTKEHVDKSKKERDPILFGMFQSKEVEATAERLYFIGDWEDEYCDLTLDRLVSEMKIQREDKENDDGPVDFKLRDPKNLEELRAKIKALDEEKRNSRFSVNNVIYSNNSSVGTQSLSIGSTAPLDSEPTPEVAPAKEDGFFRKIRKAILGK